MGHQEITPVEIVDNTVCVYGGGLGDRNEARYWQRVWLAKVLDRGEKRFVVIDKRNPQVAKFLGHNFDMVDRLTRLRNDLVSEKIAAKGHAGDDEDEPPHKKLRVDAIDEIDRYLTLSVDVDGDPHTMVVLPAPHKAHKLCVELVPSALELLLRMPDGEEDEPFVPEIPCECPNVAWRGGIEATLYTRFWSDGKWKYSLKSVPRGDSDDDTWSQRVRDASLMLQNTFARKHAPPASDEEIHFSQGGA